MYYCENDGDDGDDDDDDDDDDDTTMVMSFFVLPLLLLLVVVLLLLLLMVSLSIFIYGLWMVLHLCLTPKLRGGVGAMEEIQGEL